MARHKMHHERFARLAMKVEAGEPPCMSAAEDWEAGHRWMDELAPPADAAPLLPDNAGMQSAYLGARDFYGCQTSLLLGYNLPAKT